ncbi:hypothetical protein [Listeria monocytogenes]|uniref:hypothetical protein n=1 Tax=Listeria monocytogenes TaxID=1639 RepID=UPI00190F5196|nr:hypothetical protein [Listeria monocytogenes]ELS8113146.1 hypothetical protein [Listeria monocytogenes]EMB0338014.1 hypothetical protein [Listeria monocytogenes]HCU0628098.1 hypothetical protein [Listeria monocytogenes]
MAFLGLRKGEAIALTCGDFNFNENQFLYKAHPKNIMDKGKKHFLEMKIIKMHDFGKTNAFLLFESGASIKNVAQRLEHQSTKTITNIYIKATPTKQNENPQHF